MNFQVKALAAAVLATVSGAAFALPQSTVIANVVDISGASAQENGIILATVDICQPGTIDIYSQTNQRVATCVLKAAFGGTSVAIRKSSVGGSANGVVPIENAGIPVPFMTLTQVVSAGVTTIAAAGCVAVGTSVSTGFGSYLSHACTNGTGLLNVVPEVGFSDVEPALLGGTGAGLGTGILSFGVIASKSLYEALQASQGLSVGALDPANMPSLSQEELASVYAGNLLSLGALTGQPVALTAMDDADTIHVCRRVSTSGSQATQEVVFMNQRCNPNVPGVIPGTFDTNGVTSVLGDLVYEGSGSGNLVSCMNFWEADDGVGAVQPRGLALGGVSTETRVAGANTFRYIKIDGYSPSIENIINGNYSYWGEASAQAATDGRVEAIDTTVFNAIVARLTSPSLIQVLNTQFDDLHNTNGAVGDGTTLNGGYIGTAVSVAASLGTPDPRPVTAAQAVANPLTNSGKQFTGSLQNCGAQIFNP